MKRVILGEGYVDGDSYHWNGQPGAIKLFVTPRRELVRTYQKRLPQLRKSQPYRLVAIPINRAAYNRKTKRELGL